MMETAVREARVETDRRATPDNKARGERIKMLENNEAEDVVISLTDVSKEYDIGDTKVTALRGAGLTIRKGDFVSIVGPSGSGKSTMMNIIGCLDRSFAGEYELSGKPVDQYSEKELAQLRNKEIGFVFQDFNLIGNLTAYENVELPLIYKRIPESERKDRVEKALERVGLKERGDHKPSELSGGQQQRAAIARAIVTEPSLILADEPTKGLDCDLRSQVQDTLCSLKWRSVESMLVITHDLPLARELCDSIAVMYAGQIVEMGQGVLESPLHPYTKAFLNALPENGFQPLEGVAPRGGDRLPGCPFAPRCPHARERCHREQPDGAMENGRRVRCFLYE